MKQVAEYKKKLIQEFQDLSKEYPIIGIINMQSMPAPQLQNMREQLRSTVVMRMTKKTLIKLTLEKAKADKQGVEKLEEYLNGMPAFIFTKDNPFKLFRTIKKNKSKAPAKAGQTAPNDIEIKAGPTPFAPGPIIGELGQLGLKTGVENGKVAVKEDKIVVKEGEVITDNVASVLTRLDIKPMEIGLDLVAVFENGTIFTKKVLNVDEEEFLNNILGAARDSFNLAMEVGYFTSDTVEPLVQKAFRETKALILDADLFVKDFVGDVFAKAVAHADSVKTVAQLEIPDKPVEVKSEPAESVPDAAPVEPKIDKPAEKSAEKPATDEKVEKIVEGAKDHAKGKNVKADDLVKEASDVVKKIQKGETPSKKPVDDVPSAHDLAKRKESKS